MEEDTESETKGVSIGDCFEEFRKEELLDEDNKWYCNKCKEHVQATKTMEIFKAPPILVINLKRFKKSQSRYGGMGMFGGGGMGQKIDVEVDFPLEGLDMSKYVMGAEGSGQNMIYDCYAVSNHYGNMGFGHYTAYCSNALDGKWYEFDDSRVSSISPKNLKHHIVTNAAYNLFFRRREWHAKNMSEGIDYEKMAIKPDMDLVNKK